MAPMNRQQRRRDRRRRGDDDAQASGQAVRVRPWYIRFGYHVGVWGGAAAGVISFAITGSLVPLIIALVAGQVVGILLARIGRGRG